MLQRASLLLFLLLNTFFAWSQCSQSSGVPIIKETFGAGINQFGPALPNGVTNMQYSGSACPIDGSYTIVNYTTGCFGEWQTLTDHTGDQNGYYMLIDASFTPSDFYVQTVNGLCEGTTYEFSAYILNMFAITGGINPDITFTIEKADGTILQTYNSGPIDITNPIKWKKCGFNFKTLPGISTVVLRMHNNAPGGQGNDLAIDDISFTPTGPKTTISADGFLGDIVTNTCYLPGVNLSSAVETCFIKNDYQWQISTDNTTWAGIPGANAQTYQFVPSSTGTFYFRLNIAEDSNSNCGNSANSGIITVNYTQYDAPSVTNTSASICPNNPYQLPSGKFADATGLYSDTVFNQNGCPSLVTNLNLTVHNRPDLGTGKHICVGDSVILTPGVFAQYLWQDGSTQPTFTVRRGGIYSVKVTDEFGCETADTVSITESSCTTLKPPNTFTPNNDGINDTWNISDLQYFPGSTVFIYSRWGRLVFKSVGYSKAWDGTYKGKNLPAGTYYYVINLGGGLPRVSGYVALIR